MSGSRERCHRCSAPLFVEDGVPFCYLCGTLRRLPPSGRYRENPGAASLRQRRESIAPRAGDPWTAAEERYLVAHLADMSVADIAEALGRSPKGVQTHLDLVLNLPKPYVRRSAAGELAR